jgi:deoxyribodipyrimidine photo-lyase
MVTRAIFHFTHDLRLDDHAGLARAGAAGDVIPVLVVDPALGARLRRSPRRAAYYCDAVRALDAALQRLGTRLIVRRGNAATILRGLARATGAATTVWSASYDALGARADRDLQAALEEAGIAVATTFDAAAVPPDETSAAREAAGEGYRSFTAYYAAWRGFAPQPVASRPQFATTEIASEALPFAAEFGSSIETLGALDEGAVRAQLERFLEGPVLNYAAARHVPSAGATSRLSAPLSFGLLGARTVVAALRARGEDPFLLTEERASLALFERALAQRDFFLQLAHFYDSIEEAPLQGKMRRFTFAKTHPALDAWRSGRTGYPLVDAAMRELRATGWMHPRLRAVAASFLCFDLGVDWRVGRDEWERYLIEDEPALASGNWQWVAGVGADLAAYPRIYNPLKQARRFDPAASYVRKWIPELAARPDYAILDPGAADRTHQVELPLFGESRYPAPVVDHEVAARAFLERYKKEVAAAPAALPF